MKNRIYNILLLVGTLFLTILTACSDDDNANAGLKVTHLEMAGVTDGTVALIEGDTWDAAVTAFPENAVDAAEYTYTYTSSNENVFVVDETGKVTATGVGEAALTAWSSNNTDMWTSCVITVEKRIYPVTSIEVADDYKEYYMPVGGALELGKYITVLPDNATDSEVIYLSSNSNVATVNSSGEISALEIGDAVITVKAVDGSGVTATCNIHVREPQYVDIERTGWTVTTSHSCPSDAAVGGAPEKLIDEDMLSCILMVKPGKTLGGVTVGADEEVYFVIDMQQSSAFDYFRLRHRSNNTSANLRVKKVSVFGSNDNETFDELVKDASIATNVTEVTVTLPQVCNYRYFKLVVTGWNTAGNTIQMSDFNIGKMTYE